MISSSNIEAGSKIRQSAIFEPGRIKGRVGAFGGVELNAICTKTRMGNVHIFSGCSRIYFFRVI